MDYNKSFPVGTIVLLKDGKKKVMITGFGMKAKTSGKVYDYTGCVYPEGYTSADVLLVFDHSDIKKVFHMGYKDDDEKEFKEKLDAVIKSKN